MNKQSHVHSRIIAISLFLTATMLLTAPVYAHHSAAKYDTKQAITITGAVTRYEWANPHVYIFIEQTTDAGKKIEWEIEGSPPSIMRRMGWSVQTLHVGDLITVGGSPARDPNDKSLIANTIKRADSTLLDFMKDMQKFASVGGGDAPKFSTKGLDGIWMTQFAMQLIVKNVMPDASTLTDEGVRTLKSFDEKTMNPAANCVPFPSPMLMISPDLKRITQGDGVIYFESEFEGARRTVHLNVATHEGATPSIQGHSIGKWEGKALVVDTTNFAYHSIGHGYGVPSGSKKHLTERLTLNTDGTSLTYHFEVTDPEYLKEPRVGDVQWAYRPDQRFAPEKCNLENARRFIKR